MSSTGESRSTRSGKRFTRIQAMDSGSSDEEPTPVKKEPTPKNKEPVFKPPGTLPSTSRSQATRRGNLGVEHQSTSKDKRKDSGSRMGSQLKQEEEEDANDIFFGLRPLKVEEMIPNACYYIAIVQGKLPSRKSDIVKLVMNKQSKDFKKVIKKVAKSLLCTFGLRLIGMKNGPNDRPVVCEILEATSFITVNKFRQRVIALSTPDQTFACDLVKAALFLILTCSYMTGRTLDEDIIWDILEKMHFAQHFCKSRDDLRKVLKTEYLDRLYLAKDEIKDGEQHIIRYGWGLRAEQEFSKYALLKFVAQTMCGLRPEDFQSHFSKISREEIEQIEDEDNSMKRGPRSTGNEFLNESVTIDTGTTKESKDGDSEGEDED